MFLTWGRDHHVLHNDAFETAFADPRVIMGRPFRSAFPETVALLEPLLEKTMQGDGIYAEDFSIPVIRQTVLTETWWSFSYSPLRNSEGEISGVQSVVYETTGRVIAEKALQAREHTLQSVTDMAPTLLWRCDPGGQLRWANQMLKGQWALDDVTRVRFQDHIHPDDLQNARTLKEGAIARRQTFEAHIRLKRSGADYHWFVVRSEPIWGADGALLEWCGSAVDVDEWRRGQHEQGLNEIFAVASAEATLVWTADVASRRVTSLNPEFRSSWALALSTDPTPWETWVSTLYIEDRPHMSRAFDRLASGETLTGKFRVQTTDGALCWFYATGFPIVDLDGVVRRLGGFLVDVTQKFDPYIYPVGFTSADNAALVQEAERGQIKVRAFSDLEQFADVADTLTTGVVVIADAAMLVNSTHNAAILKLTKDRLPWLVVGSASTQLGEAVKLSRLGAVDVLDFGTSPAAILSAALAVSPDPEDAVKQAPVSEARRRFETLGHRQRDVLKGLLTGGSNKSIARDLQLSPRTIETYRAQLMDTVGVKSLAELLKLAAEAGLE
jgi:FixJ family two-component response regulator/PAS domain-containing protein